MILKDNQIVYAGQTAIYKNDKFFEKTKQTKILLFKQDRKQIWKFLGECVVLSQIQMRVIDTQQPILPKWVLQYEIPHSLSHWNDELNNDKINGYLHQTTIFEYIHKQIKQKPIHRNARDLGIVELKYCVNY